MPFPRLLSRSPARPAVLARRLAALALLAAGAGLAHADILIGQTTAVTGPVAASVGETLLGVHAYLDSVNAQGGVNGEKIKLITLDDNFKPRARPRTRPS